MQAVQQGIEINALVLGEFLDRGVCQSDLLGSTEQLDVVEGESHPNVVLWRQVASRRDFGEFQVGVPKKAGADLHQSCRDRV